MEKNLEDKQKMSIFEVNLEDTFVDIRRPQTRLGHLCKHNGTHCFFGSKLKINGDLFVSC